MAKKEVATKQAGAIAERPAFLEGGSGRGSEGVSIDDLVIPRLELIQSLSPQRKKSAAEYIEGAEEGMGFITVSNHLFADAASAGIQIIPVYFRQEFVIWKDRDSGGGFNGAFATEQAANQHIIDEGLTECEVSKTDQQFVLVNTGEGWEECVISMARAKLKASRNLNSLVKIAGGDRFSRVYRLNSVEVDGPKGEYYNWKVAAIGYVDEPAYRQAESLYESVLAGQKDVAREEPNAAQTVGDSI